MNKIILISTIALALVPNLSFANDVEEEKKCPNEYQTRRISEIKEADEIAVNECSEGGKLVESVIFRACGETYIEHICLKEVNEEPKSEIKAR